MAGGESSNERLTTDEEVLSLIKQVSAARQLLLRTVTDLNVQQEFFRVQARSARLVWSFAASRAQH